MNAGFIGRIASAVLVAALGIGLGGIGTASAASIPGSDSGAHISIGVKASTNTQIQPGTMFTDIFTITNDGLRPANNTTLLIPYDSAQLKLVDVSINREGAWVTDVTTDGFQTYLGRLSSNGDSIMLSARFTALPGYNGAVLQPSMLQTKWSDATGDRTSQNAAMLVNSNAGMNGPIVRANPVAVSGDNVVVYSPGFAPGESVTFWYNAPDGSVAPLYVNGGNLTTERRTKETASDGSSESINNSQYLVADDNGVISTSFSVKGLQSGSYSIVAAGATNGHQTVIPFTAG